MKYRKLTPEELKELQDHLFQFLCEFDDFCTKHNIQYLLNGGNVLGAVRHQDFIPWDDDLDIVITPEELEKFIALKHTFPNHWQWERISATNHVAKLFSNKYHVYAKGRKGKIIKSPIWIDFFPIEPKGISGIKASKILAHLRNRNNYPSWHWRHFLPHWFRNHIRNKAQKLFNIQGEEPLIWCHQNIFFMHTPLPLDCLYPPKRIYKIRNRLFPGPCDAKKYLTAEYGSDYMTPPPPEKQHWHCFTIEE